MDGSAVARSNFWAFLKPFFALRVCRRAKSSCKSLLSLLFTTTTYSTIHFLVDSSIRDTHRGVIFICNRQTNTDLHWRPPNGKLFLNEHLKTHEWLVGHSFTVADIYAFVCLSWTNHMQIDLAHGLT